MAPTKGADVTADTTERTAMHRNEVYLGGALTTEPEERTLADGRDVVLFRLDSFDITLENTRAQKAARSWAVGDVIEVEGSLRRRFARTAAGLRPFVVVEATRAKRVRR